MAYFSARYFESAFFGGLTFGQLSVGRSTLYSIKWNRVVIQMKELDKEKHKEPLKVLKSIKKKIEKRQSIQRDISTAPAPNIALLIRRSEAIEREIAALEAKWERMKRKIQEDDELVLVLAMKHLMRM